MATTTAAARRSPPEWISTLDRLLHDGSAPLAVALTDLDGFAELNSAHGHSTGDRVIAAWERTLVGSLPKEATVVRLGGDEHAVALPGHSAESALILLEEVRAHFSSHPVAAVGAAVNASAGVAAAPPIGGSGEDLHRAAGEALMRAKREGRGRVAIYVEERMTLKSNYYSRASLERLAKLSAATGRTEASLLREALDDLFEKHRDSL